MVFEFLFVSRSKAHIGILCDNKMMFLFFSLHPYVYSVEKHLSQMLLERFIILILNIKVLKKLSICIRMSLVIYIYDIETKHC